jgi:hypothetical protein
VSASTLTVRNVHAGSVKALCWPPASPAECLSGTVGWCLSLSAPTRTSATVIVERIGRIRSIRVLSGRWQSYGRCIAAASDVAHR